MIRRGEFVRLWARPLWMLEPDIAPWDVLETLGPITIKPMSIHVVHGTVRPARQWGLADQVFLRAFRRYAGRDTLGASGGFRDGEEEALQQVRPDALRQVLTRI